MLLKGKVVKRKKKKLEISVKIDNDFYLIEEENLACHAVSAYLNVRKRS